MKVEAWLFGAGTLFFGPIGAFYGLVTNWTEPVGFVALFLTAGLSFLIGIYMFFTSRRIDPRPEDDANATIEEGAGELGTFAPYSWWPIALALGGAIVFFGAAIGVWLMFIGAGVSAIALVGWVFEYYRGEHAH